MPLDAAYAEVQQLTPSEWKQLKAKMLFDSKYSKNKDAIEQSKQDWLLQAAIAEIRARGIERIPNLFYVRDDNQFYQYNENARFIRDLLDSKFPNPTRRQQIALGGVCISCLARYLERFTQVSLASLLCHISKVPQALNQCAPGYLEGGMLRLLVQREI